MRLAITVILTLATTLGAVEGDRTLDAFDLVEALPMHSRLVMVHVDEGHVLHHGLGQPRQDDRVEVKLLDTAAATRADQWSVTGPGLPAAGVHPVRVGRKSKGTDFAWRVEGWDQATNRTVNTAPDQAKEHWLYLELPQPLQDGGEYRVTSRVDGIPALPLVYAADRTRSEAVHVNTVGYAPDSPAKFAYVSHWAGDLGGVDFASCTAASFRLIDQASGKAAFTGHPAFRLAADRPETQHGGDTPNANFSAAATWECDFSAFTRPGTYVVAVDGVGCSFPFVIDADAYRAAYRATARALYHNRSGIALEAAYTDHPRPAPHHPRLTPGFAGKLQYTTSRWVDWRNADADAADRPAIEAGQRGPIDVWGWYQDAGDWDSYASHTVIASCLLFAYETAPGNFADGDLGIPESGNGVPDLIDEAAWLPRFGHRLRQALLTKGWGTGGLGLRVCGDHFGDDGEGKGSWQDVERTWIVSGEDPWSTMRYAAICAHLAQALRIAGVADPKGVDWLREAREAYAWAEARFAAEDVTGKPDPREQRAYAAAGLYRLTGEAAFERQLAADTAHLNEGDELWWEQPYALWVHALAGGAAPADAALARRLRAIALRSCELVAIANTAKRAMRWGGHWPMPMLIGHQTTPWILDGIVGHALTRDSDPAAARAYRAAVHTTADYFLGGNPLNLVWMTGLGPRRVRRVFHMDSWYRDSGFHPGMVPYGPWRKEKDVGQGPWDQAWPHPGMHPAIDAWPGAERWFDNSCSPMSSEFTVHQNICHAAAVYGWLCAPVKR